MTWWYLSFAGEASFMGGVIVEGASWREAIYNAHQVPNCPSGEVRFLELPAAPPAKFRGRMLSREEVLGRELATWGKQATRRIFRPGADIIGRRRRRRRRRPASS